MSENPYESESLLSEYLLFHYGSAEEILPDSAPKGMVEALDFAVRTTTHFTNPHGRALDLGCAVGRSAYELSRTCDEVIGIDFSNAFIDAATTLLNGEVPYKRHDEGRIYHLLSASMPDGARPEVTRFEQGDATNLRNDLGSFDCVHAANLICRLPDPQRLLDRLPDLVKAGGELVIATPCTWFGEFTPPENWPIGSTLEWLKEALSKHFELIMSTNEPFLIRETARKFQWTSSEVSLWKRHS